MSSLAPTRIVIDYAPRPLQREVHKALDAHRWAVAVAHRRFGKTVLAVNHLQRATLKCPKERPRFHYIAPTYRQGKAAAWDYLQHYSAPIPGVTKNQAELRIDYPNGGRVTILGADNPDSMRGIYSDGAVFDEYGLMPSNVFSEVMRPALSDRTGWAFFIGTPNGKNQFWDIAEQAKREPGWYYGEFRASQTGLLPPEELASAKMVMSKDEYAQEYECSFEASVKGAIYANELNTLQSLGRLRDVPYEPLLPVDTAWDLGIGDAMAIWFAQQTRAGEVRLIDYYESSGEGFPHYAQVLKDKGYAYGSHIAPHDIQVKELASGRSRFEAAAALGLTFQIAPRVGLEDGIHAVRMLLPRCYFDKTRTQVGLEALQNYRRDYNTRLGEFKAVPVHDFASHGADALRMLAVTLKDVKKEAPKAAPYRPVAAWT